MLAHERVSQRIENERKTDPYHMTSWILALGSLFTEGDHLYIDQQHPLEQDALRVFMETLETLEQRFKAKMVVLRDFSEDTNLHPYFQGQGFIRIQMPKSCQVSLEGVETLEAYINRLSTRNKRHIRKEIWAVEPLLEIDVLPTCNATQLRQIQELYENVRLNNLGLNTFGFPDQLFDNMSKHPLWEFITVSLRDHPERMIGAML